MTPFNPEGHPPPGVNAQSMKILIDRLELDKNNDRASFASVVKSVGLKEPKKVKEVSFYPQERIHSMESLLFTRKMDKEYHGFDGSRK